MNSLDYLNMVLDKVDKAAQDGPPFEDRGLEVTYWHKDTPPTVEDAQDIVGGYVEVVRLPDGDQLLVNEDAISQGLGINRYASIIAHPHRIYGDALVLTKNQRWE